VTNSESLNSDGEMTAGTQASMSNSGRCHETIPAEHAHAFDHDRGPFHRLGATTASGESPRGRTTSPPGPVLAVVPQAAAGGEPDTTSLDSHGTGLG
jgi:hypothetical protein